MLQHPKFQPNTDEFSGGVDFVKKGQSRPVESTKSILTTRDQLLAENDEGCIEYKWRLTGITPQRLEHLITQMKFRVAEGKGQCLYELGVADDGEARGLIRDDFDESVATVKKMAKRLGFHAKVNCVRIVSKNPLKKCCEIVVTKGTKADTEDLSIAVCGSVDAGKSTLISVLSSGELDDGQGSARQGLFNHKHEIDTGRTSSLSQRVIGFDELGRVTNFEDEGSNSLAHAHNTTKTIADRSVRLVNLMDLAGDARYAKTTIFGMTSRSPGYACIVVGLDQPVDAVAQYFHLCHALRIPHFVVVTKADTLSSDDEVEEALDELIDECNAARFSQLCDFFIPDSTEHAVSSLCNASCESKNKVPVFAVSSITGTGIGAVRAFLHQLPHKAPPTTGHAEVLLDGESYRIADVGTVITGYVTKGTITVGNTLMLGPNKFGAFNEVTINSIHVNGQYAQSIQAGNDGAFAINHVPAHFDITRKGGILTEKGDVSLVCREFDAEVTVLTPDVIMTGQEPILHCKNIRQAVKILSITAEGKFLKRNQTGKMRCRLLYHPEMLDVGSVVVLRANNTAKIIGKLTSVYPLTPAPSMSASPMGTEQPATLDAFPSPQSDRSEAEASPETASSHETSPTGDRPQHELTSTAASVGLR